MARDGSVGVKNLHLAPINDLDTLSYAKPIDIGSYAGLVSMSADRNVSSDPAYANDDVWINAQTDTGGTGTITIRDITNPHVREVIAYFTGYMVTTEGDVLALADEPAKPCAILCEQTGYIHGRRKLFYHCELGKPNFSAQTKEANTQVGSVEIPFTFYPVELAAGVRASTRDSFYGNSTYEGWFNAVVKTASAKTFDATLSALTIGTLTLSPTFAAGTTIYTASTTNASDAITATPTSNDATVKIKNGSTDVASGTAATWASGANTVTVEVTHGPVTKTYTVTVTKS